jgi:hypothetical protein
VIKDERKRHLLVPARHLPDIGSSAALLYKKSPLLSAHGPALILPPPSGNWASVALKARRQNELSLILTRIIRSGKATQRLISRTVKPFRVPREHYAFIADLLFIANFISHYSSFMAGIYSSAHTRTFCYSPQIRARSIRCAPEFSS